MNEEASKVRQRKSKPKRTRSKSPAVRGLVKEETEVDDQTIRTPDPVLREERVTVETASFVVESDKLHLEYLGGRIDSTVETLSSVGSDSKHTQAQPQAPPVAESTTSSTNLLAHISRQGTIGPMLPANSQLSPTLSTLNNLMLGSLFDSLQLAANRTRLEDVQEADVNSDGGLALMEFSILLSSAVKKFVRILAKYWVDEHGDGPVGRFLRFDRPIGGLGPTRRVVWYLFVGFCLSVIALVLTEDEYYTGPKLDRKLEEQLESSDFYPVHISFENLGCYMQNVGPVLANISGDARPGRLVGILGASGSGKTTLAHALLGRSRKSCTVSSGSVYLNGAPGSLDSFLDRVGFVPQDDVLYAKVTVMEALRFSARSRLPRYLSEKAIDDIIQETIQTLDLAHLVDSEVGGPKKRGLSGGERKRVSIGVELVALPSVLVLDEPTSGLDGAQAHKLIGTLKYIASKFNVSVITVIHQPSARSFSLLDDLILLQKGKLVYFGERAEAMSYFSQIPSLKEYFQANDLARKDGSGVDSLSPAEILLDVSTGFTLMDSDFMQSEFFKRKTKEIREREKQFRIATRSLLVEDEIEYEVQREFFKEQCGGYRSELLRILCNIRNGLAYHFDFDTAALDSPRLKYTKRAKKGIIFQANQWWRLLWSLTFRRGIKTEVFSIIILAATCSYVRHFNRSWQKKQVANFYISVSVGMVAMMGAALEEDILPVRRAVNSGMLLGAHEFALVMHSLQKGALLAHLFAFCYFAFRWIFDPPPSAVHLGQGREFCCTPFSWRTYLRFVHIVRLNYFCARWGGLLVMVLVDHEEKKSMVACCALLVSAHAFSLYSPQASQLLKDGFMIRGINFGKPMLFLCSFSYVRYFLEAMYLWDPDPGDRVGREFVMRYFSYRDGTEAVCATTMVGLTVMGGIFRFVIFAFRNANDYASFYDAPAFLIFLSKILVVYILLFVVAVIFHEFTGIQKAWKASIGVALQKRRSSMNITLDDEL